MNLSGYLPKLPGLVIAYHGCDKQIADKVISGAERIKDSKNDYDWLGHGQYFWEGSYQRAWDWAYERSKGRNPQVRDPAVIGAVIDMGSCLNLVDTYCISLVKEAYKNLVTDCEIANENVPSNKNIVGNYDKVLRYLDCAVINYLCENQEQSIDTIRGVFLEGDSLYDNAGFKDKTHIQICVRNPDCIKGYFIPRELSR